MSQPQRLIAGAMSGTSADGVDIALTAITGLGTQMSARLVQHHHLSYSSALRKEIFTCRQSQTITLDNLAKLGRDISLAYAKAIQETLAVSRLNASDLAAIAAHGQTLFHNPPNTIQWLDPSLIAAEVGCSVISDFRRADCAAGGQGAPLVPFADYILFRHAKKNRVLLNIGGIANLTFLKAGAELKDIIAFDTGPGNCISDHLMRTHAPAGTGFDANGSIAAQSTGQIGELANRVLENSFFSQPPPKSTDGPAMIAMFESVAQSQMKLPDLLFAACTITASAVARAIQQLPYLPDEIIVSGGGAKNRVIVGLIRDRFGQNLICSDKLGVLSDAKEAIAFALLGAATLDHFPSNVPSVTGAKSPVVLGSITPKPHA
jgi:anhydro-N-acetylmuramic acid kinase